MPKAVQRCAVILTVDFDLLYASKDKSTTSSCFRQGSIHSKPMFDKSVQKSSLFNPDVTVGSNWFFDNCC
jgi:hypothetical protein